MANFSMAFGERDKEFDTLVKNLEGIFSKLDGILDTSPYQDRFQSIISSVQSNPDFLNKMPMRDMQHSYEMSLYAPYVKELKTLTQDIERDLFPYYEIYLLTKKIQSEISSVRADGVTDFLEGTIHLLQLLRNVTSDYSPQCIKITQEAYQVVYDVLLLEEMFDRHDVYQHIKMSNHAVFYENIGRILEKDLERLSEKTLLDDELRHLSLERLGYDFLSSSILLEVAKIRYGEDGAEYLDMRKKAILDLTNKVQGYQKDSEFYHDTIKSNNHRIRNLRFHQMKVVSRVLPLVLVPFFTFGVGKTIGKKASDTVLEYQTVTRTINPLTEEIIGDEVIVFDDELTTYVATVMEYEPWVKNPTGVGYIRHVTAYEFTSSVDGTSSSFEDYLTDAHEKYRYVESKQELEEGDSQTDAVILVTETYQNKDISRVSTKYVVPFALLGAGIGLIVDVLLLLSKILKPKEIYPLLKKLEDDIQYDQYVTRSMREHLLELREKLPSLITEYQELSRKYGLVGEEFTFSDDDTKPILDFFEPILHDKQKKKSF